MPVALGIGIGVLALFLFAYGSALAAHHQSTGWLGWVAEKVGAIPLFGPLTIANVIRLNEWIASSLRPVFDYANGKVAGFLATIGELHGWGSRNQYRAIQAQFNTAVWAAHKFRSQDTRLAKSESLESALLRQGKLIPLKKLRDWQARYAAKLQMRVIEADILRKLAHDPTWQSTIAADFPLARPGAGARTGYTKAQIDARIKAAIAAALAAIAIPLPRVIPGKPIAVPKSQTKVNKDTNSRLKRLEKSLGITGLAALVTATFGGEITRFLRCPNTRGIAKAWCGANLASLLGLLGAAVAIEEGIGIEDFAKAMLAIEKPVVDGIFLGINEFEGLSV